MKILICAEFFYPSVGGVQEVIKQLSLRLISKGHEVTVATSSLKERTAKDFNGIHIESFDVSGNFAKGLYGDVEKYRDYVISRDFDVVFIYAAQQWTFDALIGYFQKIKAKKIFVPCGFSGLYNPGYEKYFSCMPEYLKLFDALIFHSKSYRDFEFAKKAGINKLFFIPNGADKKEFLDARGEFRSKFSIPKKEIILLTVGSLNGAKGHLEVVEAFSLVQLKQEMTLILNGNSMPTLSRNLLSFIVKKIKEHNLNDLKVLFRRLMIEFLTIFGLRETYYGRMKKIIDAINLGEFGKNKKIIQTNLNRKDLVDCFLSSNLFVFASKIEYSPLVLFESCAAGLPFLTVPVGNSQEIVDWTGGGEICDANINEDGFTVVDPARLAFRIEEMLRDEKRLEKLSSSGHAACQKEYNWDAIADKYENIFISIFNSKKEKKNE